MELNPDGYNHLHAYVRIRFGTLGLLAFAVLSKLHIPRPFLVESGDLPHHPDCTPGVDGIAVGVSE